MTRKKTRAQQPPLPSLTPSTTRTFEQDVKRCAKRGKDLAKLWAIVGSLCARQPHDASRRDHKLQGDRKGYRECHIEGDWLLIYRVVGDKLELTETGTHSDLFE